MIVEIAAREDVQRLEAMISGVDTKFVGKIGSLETKIAETKTEILRWMFGQTIVLLGALFGLIDLGH